ncbi:hypothetical protein KTR9_5356 (plasmid) [Gordonia sp. KTR9]|nr:hypothetical protein KTR9_5356 [Gordonia sp. KTR9]
MVSAVNRTDQFEGPYEVVFHAVVTALTAAGFTLEGNSNPVTASAPRAIRKNRWAATLTAGIRPADDLNCTLVDWTIDTNGRQHHLVLDEIVAKMGVPASTTDEKTVVSETDPPQSADPPKSGRTLRPDVQASLARASVSGSDRILGKAAHRLDALLHPDERVLILLHGSYELKVGLLCLTTERLMYVGDYLGPRTEIFPFDAIESVGFRRGLITSDITINMTSHVSLFSEPRPAQLVEELVAQTTAARERATRKHSQTSPRTDTSLRTDVSSALRQLADLHNEGLLSDHEYNRKKAEVLDRL